MKVILISILLVICGLLVNCMPTAPISTANQGPAPDSFAYYYDSTHNVGIWVYYYPGGSGGASIAVLPTAEFINSFDHVIRWK